MAPHRIATFSADGSQKYGAVIEGGIVDLSARFGKEYRTLREAIAGGALMKLGEDAARRSPDFSLDAVTWLPPIPSPEKIICIGVNYPDRNAEYKDGQDAPKYPSMFMRTPRSFVGHETPLVRRRAIRSAALPEARRYRRGRSRQYRLAAQWRDRRGPMNWFASDWTIQ
jgi:2-keto-4-pentenoate hydratase/2-oxohepta-3-ene-1,7-dioic acid hydratase in catechol pathway